MSSGHEIDGEYAICPYCGEKHGDCWEWLTSESAQVYECQNPECGKEYIAWAEYDVQFHTKRRDPELAAQFRAALEVRDEKSA